MDDEPLAREVISRYIARIPSLQLVAQCENALQALTVLQQQEVDLVFADIQMPELLGTDLIKTLQHPPKVIITTAYPEYAMEGYELDVADYLLKPIRFERFLKAVNKIFRQEGVVVQQSLQLQGQADTKSEEYLYFRNDRKMVKLMLDMILCVEGMKNYAKIITEEGTLITKNSMSAMVAMLPEAAFIRVHRSYIVSKSKIKSYTNEIIEIRDMEIPIGKLFKNNVLKLLS